MLSNFNLWQLLGGLGLFLFAMGQIERALSQLGSQSFKKFLMRNTNTPIRSVLSGGATTAMLQSSSLVGLLVLAFTGAGLISLENALGVIFGSNFGTTLTGWIVATIGFKLDLDALSLPLIATGSLLSIITKGRKQQIGQVLTAIGLLLLGLEFMKNSVGELGEQFDINSLTDFSAWQFLLFGTVFAAIVQSSSATMIIALAALNASLISLPAAAAIAIGADLGTTSTIVIGALNGVPNKKRVAAAHVIFNLTTDLIAFILLSPLLALVALAGIRNPLYSLVAFHSLFNIIGVVLFLPFIHPLAIFLRTLFEVKKPVLSQHINQIMPDVSDIGLIAIRKETAHLIGRVIQQNIRGFEPALKISAGRLPLNEQADEKSGDGPDEQADRTKHVVSPENISFNRAYHESKLLEGEILIFATDLQLLSLESQESTQLTQLLNAVREAMHSSKSIKDIQSNLNDFALSNKTALEQFSQSIRTLMTGFYSRLYLLKADASDPVLPEELGDLTKNTQTYHDELHQEILQSIHKREIVETQGSSMLNVNREILNSNLALITALIHYQDSDKINTPDT